jgi:hypothetical protein
MILHFEPADPMRWIDKEWGDVKKFFGGPAHHYDPYDNNFFWHGFPIPEQGGIILKDPDPFGTHMRVFMDDLYLCPDCGRFHSERRWPKIPWLGRDRVDFAAMNASIEERRNAKEFSPRPCGRGDQCTRYMREFQAKTDREDQEERQRLAFLAIQEQARQRALHPPPPPPAAVLVAKSASFVYLVESDTSVKIGIASDVQKRFSALQTSSPKPLKLLKSWNCTDGRTLEYSLHTKYEAYRLRGEWFALPSNELKILMAVEDLAEFLGECALTPNEEEQRVQPTD